MKTNQKSSSFDRAMKQIENEFENQRVDEVRAAQRRQLFARIRKVALVVALLGLSGVAYAYRTDIKTYVTAKLATPQTENAVASSDTNAPATPKGAASSAVSAAQANAKVRDSVIEGGLK